MQLTKIYLKNFRGYEDEEINFNDNFSLIIGKNDAGKSTILEALDIFFNGSKVSISDLRSQSSEKEISIACSFAIDKKYLIQIDEQVKTSPFDEFLVNEKNEIEIVYKYDFSSSLLVSPDIYLRCRYFDDFKDKPLISMKIADLRLELKKLPKEIEEITDKTTSSKIRLAIYKYYLTERSPSFSLQDISIKNEDCKKVFSYLKLDLPLYTLLKVDRANNISDNEIQSPLKIAVQDIMRQPEIDEQFKNLTTLITKQLEEVMKGSFEVLKSLYPGQFDNLKTDITTSWEKGVNNEIKDEEDISLNKHGSGIRRLLVLSYLIYQSKKKKETEQKCNMILAIEEPETSLHPDLQKELFNYLKEMTENAGIQVIITTHIPNFVLYANKDQLIYIEKKNKKVITIKEDDLKLKSIISALNILPDFAHRLIFCVEGQKDVQAYNILNKIPNLRAIIDLKKEDIKFLPLDGSNLISWHEKALLKDINVKEFHVYDGDVDEYIKIAKKINDENNPRKYAVCLKNRAIENYVHRIIIETTFGIDLSEYDDNKIWGITNIPKLIYIKKHGLTEFPNYDDPEKNNMVKKTLNQYKKTICNECMVIMNKELLEDLGVYQEILDIFAKLKKIYNNY